MEGRFSTYGGQDAEQEGGTGWGPGRTLLPVTAHPKIPTIFLSIASSYGQGRAEDISLLGTCHSQTVTPTFPGPELEGSERRC